MRTIPLILLIAFLALLPASGQTLSTSPASLSFTTPIGGQIASQQLSIFSSGFSFNYSISTNFAPWLSVFPTTGTTPATVTVYVNPSGLAAGSYTGFLTISSAFTAITVQVTLGVATSGSGNGALPATLGFAYSLGGTVPSSQTVAISTSPSGLNFSTSAFTNLGGNWLSVLPLAGQSPANLIVSVNSTGLAAGTYTGQVNVFVAGQENPIQIPVTFTVTPTGSTALTVSPPLGLTFNYQLGSQTLPSQQSATLTTPATSTFTVNTSGIPTWLSLQSLSGPTPGPLTIGVNPTNLGLGTYSTNLLITAANGGSANLPVTLNVSLTGTSSAARFIPVTPCRVADTRAAAGFTGVFGPPSLFAGATRDFQIPASSCIIPNNAQAYSLNITVVPPGALSFLTAWPSGQSQPNVSTLNAFDGAITSNAAIVPAGTNGSISLFATNATDVIIDINGYFTTAAAGLSLYTVTPCRLVDTRTAAGSFGGPQLTAGSTRDFNIPTSACGIPVAAQAYSLNATVVPPGPLSFLTLFPSGQVRPNASTLNSFDGAVKANAAIVPAAASGSVSAFVTDRTDLVLDINSYFAPAGFSGALSFYPLTPCRVADTRTAPFSAVPIQAGTSRDFAVVSTCGVPSTAVAYSLNVTVVPSGALGFLTLWPTGSARPLVSTLNSQGGKVLANAAIVPAGASGAVSVFVTDTTHVVLDINGYFAP